MQQAPLKNRRIKGEGYDSSKGKAKFQVAREERVKGSPIIPMNDKQRAYLKALEDNVPVIIATGYAGTSKTYIPTKFACNQYLNNSVYKIAFTRPAVSNSKSLGYFAGSKEEKMSVWLTPVLSTIKETLGSEPTELAIKREDLFMIPLEVIKGVSLSSTVPDKRYFLICDEAEDLSIDEVKKIITRVGKNCTLVLAGDVTQSELKERSGLKWLIEFVARHQLNEFVHIDFNHVNDIVRSDTVKKFITCLERDLRDEKKNDNQKTKTDEI